jgi:hypothetical protein
MVYEESHKGIQDCTTRDHIQRQSSDMVHEVQDYHVGGTSKVPDMEIKRDLLRISEA